MLLINLYGQPGAGKSTGAAYIFSKLKMNGINAELVTEFAKDKTWEHNVKALSNQAYMFGKQYYKITRCEDQVDVVITDSPLILSLVYNNDARLGEEFAKSVVKVANSFESINYFVRRVKPYNPKGRNQTESESDSIGDDIKAVMDKYVPNYRTINGDIDGYDGAVLDIMNYFKYSKSNENYQKDR